MTFDLDILGCWFNVTLSRYVRWFVAGGKNSQEEETFSVIQALYQADKGTID